MTINLYQFFGTPAWVQDLQTSMGLVLSNLSNLETMMTALDDELAAIKASIAAAAASLAGVSTDVATVKTDVESLKAQIAAFPAAGLTADQQTALDGIRDSSAALGTSVSAIDTSLQAVHAEATAAAAPTPAPAPAPAPSNP